mgnify:CR=1 FL=1
MSFVDIAVKWTFWTVGAMAFTFLVSLWLVNGGSIIWFAWIYLGFCAALSIIMMAILAVTKYNIPSLNTTAYVFVLFAFKFILTLFFTGIYLILEKESLGVWAIVPIAVFFTMFTTFDVKYLNRYAEYLDEKFKQ